MSTNKTDDFFIIFAPSCALELQLNPDIYDGVIAPILGVDPFLLSFARKIKISTRKAAASPFAQALKCLVFKGAAPNEQYRQIELICKIDKVDTAKPSLIGKTVKLGFGTSKTAWVIREVR